MRLLGGTPYIYSSVLGYGLEGAVIVEVGAEQHKLALHGAASSCLVLGGRCVPYHIPSTVLNVVVQILQKQNIKIYESIFKQFYILQ